MLKRHNGNIPGKRSGCIKHISPSTAQTTLEWKSSKAKVATEDANGLVTAVGKGAAKITVWAAGNKKAKATITVKVNSVSTGALELSGYLTAEGKAMELVSKNRGR